MEDMRGTVPLTAEGMERDLMRKYAPPKGYQVAGNTIGKYVGQEALFAPSGKAKSMRAPVTKGSAMGGNPMGFGAGYPRGE